MNLGLSVELTAAILAPHKCGTVSSSQKVKWIFRASQMPAVGVDRRFRRQKNWRERLDGRFIAPKNLIASVAVGFPAPKNR